MPLLRTIFNRATLELGSWPRADCDALTIGGPLTNPLFWHQDGIVVEFPTNSKRALFGSIPGVDKRDSWKRFYQACRMKVPVSFIMTGVRPGRTPRALECLFLLEV